MSPFRISISLLRRPAPSSLRGWIVCLVLFAGFLACLTLLPAVGLGETKAPAKDRHVVLVVWDGMRPDFVSERNTPTLWKLAREGVTFRKHHSVLSHRHQRQWRRSCDRRLPESKQSAREPRIPPADRSAQATFENGDAAVIKKGDEITGGKYLAAPTIAEIVRGAGRPDRDCRHQIGRPFSTIARLNGPSRRRKIR